MMGLRLVLLGDGESPHLLKWARALSTRVDLWVASSRKFLPELEDLLPPERRLALDTAPAVAGGNAGVLRSLPRLLQWLRPIQADWLHAHYLTSHGTLAWLARHAGVRVRIVGSAWGSDILVTPDESHVKKWLTQRVLHGCALTTSDSQHMAQRMRSLGAAEVMVFPFGLETLPPAPAAAPAKDDALFFSNRALEPLYAPQRVLDNFNAVASNWPQARLVVAHGGSLRVALQQQAAALGLAQRVEFVGHLSPERQAQRYAQARWYFSLPRSDSVSVSVLEAMAHGCVPILSDLPANRELVEHGRNGLILPDDAALQAATLQALLPQAQQMAADNHAWIAQHAYFPDAVARFVGRLQQISAGGSR